MRIAFFGLPLAALLLHDDLHGQGHEIVLASICRAGAIGTRRLRRTLGDARVLMKPDVTDAAFEARLRAARPDLVVSWFWTTLLPKRIVDAAPLGGFGVHPSLLPRHRGPDPYFWAIDEGDAVTGVTAHRIAEAYDTGDLLGARTLAIDPAWNAWTLAKRLDRPSLSLLRETVRAFARGEPPPAIRQDEANATLAPSPDDAELEIDWRLPTARIERRIRAASPWPGAFTFLGDEPITITRVAIAASYPRALAPGEAAIVGDRAVIRTGDGALELVEGRGDEDGEYPLGADDLVDLVGALQGRDERL